MLMPGRKYSSGKYRYGFNGKENDNEVKGDGNQQDYGMRVYDARLGRFLAVDPLQTKYAWHAPYHFSGNNPTASIDIDGRDTIKFVSTKIYFPKNIGPSGLQIGGTVKDTKSVVVIRAPGKDVFFVESQVVDMTIHSKPQPPVRTQFYPNGDGPNGQGGVFRSSGITQSEGGLPFTSRDDEDFTTLAKLAPQGLVDYLKKHDPERYGSLGLHKSGLALGEFAQSFAGAALLFEGGLVLKDELLANTAAKGGMNAIQAGEYTITKTVAKNLTTRPYINSPSTITNIMKSSKGVPDPFFKGGMNYKMSGTFNGANGIFELGINPETNTIYHFLFKAVK